MTAILVSSDTAPTITGIISDSAGSPVDLTASTVYFQMRLVKDKRWKVNGLCTITDAPAGAVSYDLTADDLDFAGACLARYLVIYSDSRRQHTTPAIEVTVEVQ